MRRLKEFRIFLNSTVIGINHKEINVEINIRNKRILFTLNFTYVTIKKKELEESEL